MERSPSRILRSPIVQAPVIQAVAEHEKFTHFLPKYDSHDSSENVTLSEPMRNAMESGEGMRDMITISPEEVIQSLRHHSIKRLGTFDVSDEEVLKAFDSDVILTRGSDTSDDTNYEQNWRNLMKDKARSKRRIRGGWKQRVTLAAYVVTINNAAGGVEDGLLAPLIEKYESGATSNEVWDFPAVRAVIEHKWVHWARRCLYVQYCLYLAWLISFTIFLLIYINRELNKNLKEDDGLANGCFRLAAYIFNSLTIFFMLPFLLIDCNTLWQHGFRWINLWNLIDTIAYVLQTIIVVTHLSCHFGDRSVIDSEAYRTILAIQAILLFGKIQYYSGMFCKGISFVELLFDIIERVRGFFFFIFLTTFSMALAFAVLYGDMVDQVEDDADFKNVFNSFLSAYSLLLGNFETDHVFHTSNKYVKGIFFCLFQILMSIIVLNLLIAVMTESYATVVEEKRIMYNMGRARVMNELDISLPKRLRPRLKPYCHFLVVHNHADKLTAELSADMSDALSMSRSLVSVEKDVLDLKSRVEELKHMIEGLVERTGGD